MKKKKKIKINKNKKDAEEEEEEEEAKELGERNENGGTTLGAGDFPMANTRFRVDVLIPRALCLST